MAEKKTFLAAMYHNFKRDGQSLADFNKELKELTDADRAWYINAFAASGIEIEVKQTAAVAA